MNKRSNLKKKAITVYIHYINCYIYITVVRNICVTEIRENVMVKFIPCSSEDLSLALRAHTEQLTAGYNSDSKGLTPFSVLCGYCIHAYHSLFMHIIKIHH